MINQIPLSAIFTVLPILAAAFGLYNKMTSDAAVHHEKMTALTERVQNVEVWQEDWAKNGQLPLDITQNARLDAVEREVYMLDDRQNTTDELLQELKTDIAVMSISIKNIENAILPHRGSPGK